LYKPDLRNIKVHSATCVLMSLKKMVCTLSKDPLPTLTRKCNELYTKTDCINTYVWVNESIAPYTDKK
jgi:SUMO ligase MMS21 Smc5/6 complex component